MLNINIYKWAWVGVKPPDGEPYWQAVTLPGIALESPLRRRHARMAVRLLGLEPGEVQLCVFSDDEYGYRVYPGACRKVTREFDWVEED